MELSDEALCICGHIVLEHHRSWFPGGSVLIEECEYYGSNEHGGAKFVDGKWIDHCQKFRKPNSSEFSLC